MGNSFYDLGYFQNYSYNVTNPALLFYSFWDFSQVYLIRTKGMLSPLHIKIYFYFHRKDYVDFENGVKRWKIIIISLVLAWDKIELVFCQTL